MMMTRSLAFALATLLWAAPAGAELLLFATTTNYEVTGSCSAMPLLPPHTPDNDLFTIHSDAVARAHGDHVYVVNRYQGDNILVLRAGAPWQVVTQYSTGNGSNPQDLQPLPGGLGLVPRYGRAEAWLVQRDSGALVAAVDLSGLADGDGIPEMAQAAHAGGWCFVALQNLDRNDGFSPTGQSRVAVLDPATGAVQDLDPVAPGVQAIELQLQNPYQRVQRLPWDERLGFLCAGRFGVLDGGVERIDPFSLRSEGPWFTEAQLGGELLDFLALSASEVWAILQEPSFATKLVRFDPANPAGSQQLLHSSPGYDLADLEYSPDHGRVYLADRRPQAPGVRVFDAASGAQLAGPVSTGLPPFDLVVVPGAPTAAPPPAVAGLRAWPNPTRGVARVSGGLAGAAVALELLDLRGRRVRLLPAGPPGHWRLDGRDGQGRPLAAGSYLLRELRPGGASARITVRP